LFAPFGSSAGGFRGLRENGSSDFFGFSQKTQFLKILRLAKNKKMRCALK
jgi:hypothetical protein